MQTVKTKFFEYGETEVAWLKKADKTLGEAIERIGKIDRVIIPDLFAALLYAIIGQQISLKAAQTVWDRLKERFGEICPQNMAERTVEEIKACGMTFKKAGYIKSIAEKTANGEFKFSELYTMTDEEVIKKLSSLSGIGAWTAEMLLINSMERPDVISWGDIAIRRGICRMYGLEELKREQFEQYRARYSPYGSVASIYLWWLSH